MDHQNIRFHNVEELEPVEGGWLLRRVGAAARARISPGVQENCFATGIELRFTMPDGAVDLLLKTIPQAEALEQAGIDIDCALSIEIADETIIERMSGRRTCKDCSQTFHVENNPPKVEGVCDFCGGELTIRVLPGKQLLMTGAAETVCEGTTEV